MIRIEMWGVPTYLDPDLLTMLRNSLPLYLDDIPELGASGEGVPVFIPADQVPDSLRDEIFIIVRGIPTNPQCTEEVLTDLAARIGRWTVGTFFGQIKVRCVVETVSPLGGFYSWSPDQDRATSDLAQREHSVARAFSFGSATTHYPPTTKQRCPSPTKDSVVVYNT